MKKVIEVEKKFYCNNHKKILTLIKKNKLVLIDKNREVDEYFTDINSDFIDNRTCLRIRKRNADFMELTFKGKSKEFLNSYAKNENNVSLKLEEYDNIVDILNALGYYSYSIVDKTRSTYSKEEDDIKYNVMVDHIDQVGDFVEFELLCDNENKSVETLQNKLNDFVELFSSLNFESANMPYRDFVAYKNYTSLLPLTKLKALLIDLDGTLINSEKKFFESFKKVLFQKYNVEITKKDYEENELKKNANLIVSLKNKGIIPLNDADEEIMKSVYHTYENDFIEVLNDDEVHLNFELLKRLKNKGIRLALVTTCKRKFIDILINKLEIHDMFSLIVAREDVKELKPSPDAYLMALDKMGLSSDSCIAIEDSERGIKSSMAANIKTVQVTNYLMNKNVSLNVESFDKISRILLILINHL